MSNFSSKKSKMTEVLNNILKKLRFSEQSILKSFEYFEAKMQVNYPRIGIGNFLNPISSNYTAGNFLHYHGLDPKNLSIKAKNYQINRIRVQY